MRGVGSKNLISLTNRTRFLASKQVLKATPAVRFTETLAEKPVDKGHPVIRLEQDDINREHIQGIFQPLPLLCQFFFRLFPGGDILKMQQNLTTGGQDQ